MSDRKTSARKLMLFVTLVAIGLAVLLLYLNRSGAARLAVLRMEVDRLFDALDPEQRSQHSENCVKMAREISDSEDPVGATAALYAIAAGPVSGEDVSDLEIPNEDRVETIATQDLLKIARLLFNTRRLGPADQLAGLILTREDEYFHEGLRFAITVRFEIGRDDDVLYHCEELLKKYPKDKRTFQVMALVHRNHGRWEDFIEVSEKALKIDPTDHEMRINLVDAYVRLGQTTDARRELDVVSGVRPDIVSQAPVMHSRLLLQEGKRAKAKQVLESFLKQSPDDAEALVVMGTLLLAEQKFDLAIQTLKSSITHYPADEQAYYQLGQAYARNNQADLAKETLEKHRKLLDAKVRLHEMEQLASREPQNVTVRKELAHSYAEIGLMELADFWTRSVLAAEGR